MTQAHLAGRRITLSALGLFWKELTTERGPFGSVLWLEVTPTAAELRNASTSREVKFNETGVVARMRVRNESVRPTLFPGNLIVDGGRQARVLESSVILAPDSEVEIPVRCVEKGRWHAKDGMPPSDHFEVSGATSSRTRTTFARSKSESLHAKGRYELDQRTVWNHVDEELERSSVRSSTHSYADFLEGATKRTARAAQMVERAPRSANGMAVVHDSGNTWVEVLPTGEDLRGAAASVLADLFDPAGARLEDHVTPVSVIERAWRKRLAPVEVPPRTLGSAFAFQSGRTFGSVLLFDGRLAHLGVGWAAEQAGDQ